ncbi:MAG TPA: single-stranded DNA-binding protein [Candidatus Angelobacter sp.]|jgi:single-stranded DNA-binding protein|nr:single-stranded DNA-binding protein [Candidatus Angelobacter sp.]
MTRTATPTEAPATPEAPATNGTAPTVPARRMPRPNRVELTGRLKATPSLRYTTKGGVPVADLVLVTNEQSAQEVPIVAWREIAEWAAEELEAGDPLLVLGRVVVRTYSTEDGDRTYLEIAALQLLPGDRQAQPGPLDGDAVAPA